MSEANDATVTVLFFAAARETAGTSEWRCEAVEGESVAGLKLRVYAAFPSLRGWARALRFAVDGEYASDDALVPAGCEVAVIPPVAGG
jgi:molybdopterin converting factor subunit 1